MTQHFKASFTDKEKHCLQSLIFKKMVFHAFSHTLPHFIPNHLAHFFQERIAISAKLLKPKLVTIFLWYIDVLWFLNTTYWFAKNYAVDI